MKRVKLAVFAAFFAFPVFAQQPDPEAEFRRKLEAMQAECQRIALAVPCAVGIAEVDKLPAAISKAERDAMAKLAVSVQTFVSFHAKDSSYVEGKINVENMLVANSQTVKQDYAKLADKDGEYYRAIVLKSLGGDKSLYEEAKKETEAAAGTAKAKLKQIASKSVSILLGIAKKTIGVP